MHDIVIKGATLAGASGFEEASIAIDGGLIVGWQPGPARLTIEGRGLIALPGLIDIHGDAFERQMMPRPRIAFPLDVAFLDTDAQALANGITTIYHGVTLSFEPGLRSHANAAAVLGTLEALAPRLGADTRCHLRLEAHALEAEADVAAWLAAGRIGILAYNDHAPKLHAKRHDAAKIGKEADRAGLGHGDYAALLERVMARTDEVPAALTRLAALARAHGVPQLSHDDETAAQRRFFRDLGATICEFPLTLDAAGDAAAAGEEIVFGAPNIVRGGSHNGALGAADMLARGIGSILASDYFYPAMSAAALRLEREGILPLAAAWALMSEAPARALGLSDRGRLEPGLRADVVLLRRDGHGGGSILATIAGGRLAACRRDLAFG